MLNEVPRVFHATVMDRKFQGCFKKVSGVLQGRVFQGHFIKFWGDSRKFWICLDEFSIIKGVAQKFSVCLRKIEGFSEVISRMFKWSFKEIEKVFRRYFKCASRVLKGIFNVVVWKFGCYSLFCSLCAYFDTLYGLNSAHNASKA